MNQTENSPLHTILKITKFSNLTQRNSSYSNKFPNESDMKSLLKRSHYDTVFSKIMYYFNKSTFYNEVFLPRMDKRTKFMRMNRKFTPLTQEQFEEQKEILQINNTYDGYSSRQEIPLFTYITNDPDQFENWSAIKIFEWWRSLRMSEIKKQEWPIFDAVKYLFINQFMRIMNSYLKYGVDREDTTCAFDKLLEYLRLVDVFYTNGGQYKHLLNAHLAFCEWFSARFIGGLLFESGRKNDNDNKYVNSRIYSKKNKEKYNKKFFIKHFNLTCKNNNGILFIPLSFFQKESKFINTYTAPFIVFLGINYRTHVRGSLFNNLYSPYGQIYHDIIIHSTFLMRIYKIDSVSNISEILLFEERCKFLSIVSLTKNDDFKKLLWYILHENPIYFFTSWEQFFNISILFIKLNEIINIQNINNIKNHILKKLFNKYSVDSIYTLICVFIVYFMFNFLQLNIIQRIDIIVDNLITKISFEKIPLFQLEINVETKQIRLVYVNEEFYIIELIDHCIKNLSNINGFEIII